MKVIVEYAVQDALRVWVRDLEHRRLICVAGFEANKKAFFPVSAVDDALEKRATRREELKLNQIEEIRAERDGVFGLVNVNQDSKLIEARRELELKMAADAIAVPEQPSKVIMLPQAHETGFTVPENPKEKYQLWSALDRLLTSGGGLTEGEQRFYDGFQNTATFKGFNRVNEEIKNAALVRGVTRANAQNS
jgi:putative transposase